MIPLARPTIESEWELLKSLRLASLLDSPDAFALTYDTACQNTEQDWRDRAAGRSAATYFIVSDRGVGLGMAGGVLRNGCYELIAMWVAPDWRSKGMAQALVQQVLKHARGVGVTAVELMVAPDNAAAVALYEGMGFRFHARRERLESNPHIVIQNMVAELAPSAVP